MLPKSHRLPLRFVRDRLKEIGQPFHQGNLTAIVATQESNSPSRFAVTISKKISNKAVVRNRLRRQILNALGPKLTSLKPGYDLLFITKKEIITASGDQIRADLDGLLKKTGLLV